MTAEPKLGRLTSTVSVQITDFLSIDRSGRSRAIHRQRQQGLDVDGAGSVATGKTKPQAVCAGDLN